LQAANAHANGGKGVLELPLPYALQPLLAVRRGHSTPLPKGTVVYKKGPNRATSKGMSTATGTPSSQM
jgi:hypothetical protein